MSVETASLIVNIAGIYFAIGLVFSLIFVVFGVGKIDPGAKGMPVQVRAMIFPGVIGLWPIMLVKLLAQKAPPVS